MRKNANKIFLLLNIYTPNFSDRMINSVISIYGSSVCGLQLGKKIVLVFSCTIALLQKTKYLQIDNNIKRWISAWLKILLHKFINIMFMYHLFSQLFHEYKPEISNSSNRINTYLINRWNTYTFYIGDSKWCKNICIKLSNCVCEKMFIAKSQNKHLNLV